MLYTAAMDRKNLLNSTLKAHQKGALVEAEKGYLQILQAQPQQPDALHYLGLLKAQTGQAAQGLKLMQAALKIQPDNLVLLNNLGNLYRQEGHCRAALNCFEQVLHKHPEDPEALNNRALVWLDLDQPQKASQDLKRALELPATQNSPQLASRLWFHLGRAQQQQENLESAEAAERCLRTAVKLSPNFAKAWNSLGNVLLDANRPTEAVEAYQAALQAQPNWPEPLNNLATAQMELAQNDQALQTLETLLQKVPDHPLARYNRGQLLLLKGQLQAGFAAYEQSRWQFKDQIRPLGNLELPLWQGDSDLRLLLCCEQGFGDSLQFIRYLKPVLERCPQVWLECPPVLAPLFALLCQDFPGLTLLPEGQSLPATEAWAPLLRLPHVLGTKLTTIPAEIPYLRAPKQTFPLELHPTGLNIGMVWATGHRPDPTFFKLYQRKSAPVEAFEALAAAVNQSGQTRFFSLQVGRDAQELPQIHNLAPFIHHFADTAAWIQALDLVISTDTAVAHLAGALGKPVWLLLPKIADWRWLESRSDSPWYPNMRLFRQHQAGDWSEVMRAVQTELQILVAERQ